MYSTVKCEEWSEAIFDMSCITGGDTAPGAGVIFDRFGSLMSQLVPSKERTNEWFIGG